MNRKPIESYVFFNHDPYISRIGHGYRHIDVYSVGPKWVSLREQATSGNKVRIRRSFWDHITQSKFFKTTKQAQEELDMKNRLNKAEVSAKKGCQVELIFG